MCDFQPKDPQYEQRVRRSFERARALSELGATLNKVNPGFTEIAFPYDERFSQQHGFVHAGIVATILDSACGYAAFSLMPSNAGVLTVEFKINYLAPAAGERFVARGEVLRPGRTLTVSHGTVVAFQGEGQVTVASMQATMMTIVDREDIVG